MWNHLPTLTAQALAEKEGLRLRAVTRLLREGRVFPAKFVKGRWWITEPYVIVPIPMGRPKGTTGPYPGGVKRKYPKGVKRPRKAKAAE